MPPRDWAFRIQDILEAIAKIQRYIADVDFEAFESDEEIMDAVVHNLTVIGEAANRMPADIRRLHPEIPWRQMIDLRNFTVHAYWKNRDVPPVTHLSMPTRSLRYSIYCSADKTKPEEINPDLFRIFSRLGTDSFFAASALRLGTVVTVPVPPALCR